MGRISVLIGYLDHTLLPETLLSDLYGTFSTSWVLKLHSVSGSVLEGDGLCGPCFQRGLLCINLECDSHVTGLPPTESS